MIEKMTVEDGHAPDDWVGEIHDDVDGDTHRNVHCVHPQWVRDWLIVFGVRKEMDLMDVHGMQFPAGIDNLPMLERSKVNRGGTFSSAERSSDFTSGFSEVSRSLGVVCDRDFATMSAKIIAGFGSPCGPVSTQRETNSVDWVAAGPVTIASTLPAGGNKTWPATRVG